MAAYLIADSHITDQQTYDKYKRQVAPGAVCESTHKQPMQRTELQRASARCFAAADGRR